jgi:hypothetical protein
LVAGPDCYFISTPGLLGHKEITRPRTETKGATIQTNDFANRPHFLVDIGDDRNLRVKTSLPKGLYGSSLLEVQEEDFPRAVDWITDNLKAVGISIPKNDLEDFGLSRLDYCRNIHVDRPLSAYLDTLSQYKWPGGETMNYKAETLTYGRSSSNKQFSAYNKIAEVQKTEKKNPLAVGMIKDFGGRQNILRLESRLLKGREVHNYLGPMPMNPTLKDGFTFAKAVRRVSGDLGRLIQGNTTQQEFVFSENLELLERCFAVSKRGAFNRFLAITATEKFVRDFQGDWSAIRRFLELKYQRRQVFALMKTLRENLRLGAPPETVDLIAEIREKIFLKAA